MKHAAVLGGGNGSHAMAADLALAGFEVRMYEDAKYMDNMSKVYETREILIEGRARTGLAQIACVTSDIREAVLGAEVIFIPLPAFTNDYYAEILADCAADGQIIALTPGNLGTLVFKKRFAEKNVTADIILCETSTLNYDARLLAPGHIMVYARNECIKVGALPAGRCSQAMKVLKKYYNEFIPCADVLDCGLHSLNPCLHIPGCIMNAGRIERSKGEFYLYEEGITPAVARVMEKMDRERAEIVTALGYEYTSLAEELAEGRDPRSIWEEVNGCETLEFIKGPTSLKTRYFTEDIPYGLIAWSGIADMLNIKTPLINSLIEIGSIIIDENTREMGRTPEKMGIAGMSKEELRAYLGH